MAQTTRFTSFGPVLPVVTSCKSLRNSIIPIEFIDIISIKKNTIRKKRHVLIAQTTRFASFGPVLLVVA